MAFLDFIKNRDVQAHTVDSQPQQQKTDISRDTNSQQVSRESASAKTVSQLPEEIKSQARDLGARVDQATRNIQPNAPALPQTPTDATDNQQPMRQNMTSQEKPAPDLSPTSVEKGIPMKDVEGPEPPAATPGRSQEQERHTIARPAPSWER